MIYFITKLEAKTLLTPDEHGKYHGPRPGMEFDWYLVFDDPGWTAIDNSSGDAWTEDFKTIEEAVRWLESNRSKADAEDTVNELITLACGDDGASERDYSEDDGETGNLKYDFETAFDQDRLLHLHESDVDLTELITDFYEKETGKSCVYWYCPRFKDFDGDQFKDSLPRQNDYETNGYTGDFWKWMGEIEGKAIESGVETVDEMASFFLGYLMPEAAELRGKEILKQAKQPEPPEDEESRKISLGDILPLISYFVKIRAVTRSGQWEAGYMNGDEAAACLASSPDLLDAVPSKVMVYPPEPSLTNGSLCHANHGWVVIEVEVENEP